MRNVSNETLASMQDAREDALDRGDMVAYRALDLAIASSMGMPMKTQNMDFGDLLKALREKRSSNNDT